LPAIVRDKEVGCGAHFGRMLRYLAELEMRNSTVEANIADPVEQFPFLTLATPGTQKFSYPVGLFSLLYSAIMIIKKLLNQCTVDRKLVRTKISESQITN
jgi:hypothetical protein